MATVQKHEHAGQCTCGTHTQSHSTSCACASHAQAQHTHSASDAARTTACACGGTDCAHEAGDGGAPEGDSEPDDGPCPDETCAVYGNALHSHGTHSGHQHCDCANGDHSAQAHDDTAQKDCSAPSYGGAQTAPHSHGDQESTCGCSHDNAHTDRNYACACGHDHAHSGDGNGCACNSAHSHTDRDSACGCGHDHAHADHEDGCGCGHDHGAVPEKDELKRGVVFLLASIALTFAAHRLQGLSFTGSFWVALALYLVAYALVGREVVSTAVRNVFKGRLFDENFLMTVATLGAFCIGDFAEGVAVMIFYNIGETLQGFAVAKSRANIATLMNIRPDFARIVDAAGVQTEVAPERVQTSDTIVIKPGERVPLDCVVLQGTSAVDASALTGESVPVSATPGVSLASGSVNLNGVLTCRVSSAFADSTVQKILDLVSEASSKKASAEKFITRFARVYTPIVMALALLIAVVPPLFMGFATFGEWFYRGLIFLVVSCPCALVVSIPVSFLGGIGGAARAGVLVKGGDVIDKLAQPKVVVFDKTGTLTQGKFAVRKVLPAAGVSEDALLSAAALCERSSNHPIALSVREYCGKSDSGAPIDAYDEPAGYGVLATSGGAQYAAGNDKLMARLGAQAQIPADVAQNDAGTVLHIAKDGAYLGTLFIADEVKPGVRDSIAQLRALGVERCYMLTGDNAAVAQHVAQTVGLDGFKAGLLPGDKVEAFEALTKDVDGISLYTGDGINDAPLLARADVGFAMGGVGSDAAIEAADVVLMTDEVGKIATAVRVARRTRSIVAQNIVFALGVKAVIMVLAALGYTPMWLAIFGDVGVALIAIANAARALRVKG